MFVRSSHWACMVSRLQSCGQHLRNSLPRPAPACHGLCVFLVGVASVPPPAEACRAGASPPLRVCCRSGLGGHVSGLWSDLSPPLALSRFLCDDVDFNLRAHSAGLLLCRFNRFSVMKKQIAVGGHRSFHITSKVGRPRALLGLPPGWPSWCRDCEGGSWWQATGLPSIPWGCVPPLRSVSGGLQLPLPCALLQAPHTPGSFPHTSGSFPHTSASL